MLHYLSAGPSAWFGGESGQVGNEAATAVQNQCRSQARHFICLSGYTRPVYLLPFSTESGTLFLSLICIDGSRRPEFA